MAKSGDGLKRKLPAVPLYSDGGGVPSGFLSDAFPHLNDLKEPKFARARGK